MTQRLSVEVTTDASGNAEEYVDDIPFGLLSQIRLVPADGVDAFAATLDVTITLERTGETLWAQSNVNGAATVAPRQATHSTAGVAATYDGTEPVLDKIAIANDRIKIALAQGGNTKSGTFHFTLV